MLVDDNELTLSGYVEVVGTAPDLLLAGAFGHAEALAWDGDWSRIDVVVVDAADEGLPGDQFPGVAVVRLVRAEAGEPGPTVVVVTGHYLHDGLRHRMAQAGADFYFLRANLRTRDQLLDVIRNPESYRRGVAPVVDVEQRRLLGLKPEASVDELISYADDHGLDVVLRGDGPARADPRARRWLRHRREMAKAGGIDAVNITSGDPPRGSQACPSWPQLRQIYRWAARIQPVDDAISDKND